MRAIWVIAGCLCACARAGAQTSPEAFIEAIRINDLSGMKARLESGTDADAHDSRDTTLLMHAAAVVSVDAVKLLLDGGANVNLKSQLGSTALTLAADQPEKARLLIAKGADVNAATKSGRTPLMIAACGPILWPR